MTSWVPLRFDPAVPRFDPPNVRAPRDPDVLHICRRFDRLLTAKPAEWGEKFAPYFGPNRRRDRREAIVLTLKTAFTRVDFLEGNIFIDGPASDKGIAVETMAQLTLCAPDRIKEAFGDLKTAQIERFDRCPFEITKGKLAGRTIVRRLPKSQPRSEKNGKYSAEPAIRNLHLKTIARIFRCERLLERLIKKATKRREREGRVPVPLRRSLMEARRAASAAAWRAKLRKNRKGEPTLVGDLVTGKLDAIVDLSAEQQALMSEIESAKTEALHEWRRTHGARAELPDDAWVEAEARRRIGAPPRRLE
jgi:hypothetical protein